MLAEVIGHLAEIPRAPGSPGEAQAAEWIAAWLREAGAEATVEPASYRNGYAGLVGTLTGLCAAGGLLAATRRGRRLGAALAAAGGTLIADDISNGPRLARGLSGPRATQNVVALAGDPGAERTLVVLAHHDAALTGRIFDDRLQAAFGERFPGLLERIDTSLPLWWAVLAGPILAGVGGLRRSRAQALTGALLATVATAAFADIATSPTVPGANDNLTAVAVLIALAARLQSEPVEGLRVMLVSCGAEEVIQGGIYSFAQAHFPALDRERTWMLNLDTVGSPELVLLEGEGPVVMEDYTHRPFRDLIARVADRAGAPVRRGMRARNSTDAVIPSRAGYPTATLASIDHHKALSNYHMLSDTAENVHLPTVQHALVVCEAVARELASNPWL